MNSKNKTSYAEIKREHNIHGQAWQSMHGGYFSSLEVVKPLLTKIAETCRKNPVENVIDLGGGTGFLLSHVASVLADNGFNLGFIDIDLSEGQLNAVSDPKIKTLCSSIDSFCRDEILKQRESAMFISRSTLHYYGKDGLLPAINHILQEMHKGEFFIHQTACFIQRESKDLMNLIYEMMGTGKWYPTADELCEFLGKTGFEVCEVSNAPALPLSSYSLMERYGISSDRVKEIIKCIKKEFYPPAPDVVELHSEDSFTAYLHYRIFVCRASTVL